MTASEPKVISSTIVAMPTPINLAHFGRGLGLQYGPANLGYQARVTPPVRGDHHVGHLGPAGHFAHQVLDGQAVTAEVTYCPSAATRTIRALSPAG